MTMTLTRCCRRQNPETCAHTGERAVQRTISLEKENPHKPLSSEVQSQYESEWEMLSVKCSVLPRTDTKSCA